MPVVFHLNHTKKRVTSRCTGEVVEQDFLEHIDAMRRFFEEGVLDTSWQQLIILEKATLRNSNTAALIHKLAKLNPWPSSCTRAIVTKHAFLFGISRMYQQLADPHGISLRVLKNLDDAEAYLSAQIPL